MKCIKCPLYDNMSTLSFHLCALRIGDDLKQSPGVGYYLERIFLYPSDALNQFKVNECWRLTIKVERIA